MIQEIRKWIVSILMLWAFNICPEGSFKIQFAIFLKNNIKSL